jgi:hypothetical protein
MSAAAPQLRGLARQSGLSLVELMVAGLIATMLVTGLVQVAAGARSSFALQESVAELQESARFAVDSIGGALRQSDFEPEPWVDTATNVGLGAETADGVNAHGDRIALRTRSDRNCFGALNPSLDASGRPAYFLKELVFELNSSANLAHTCRYGRSADEFVTEIRREGLLPQVEAFQALFAEDLDGDGRADRWVRGGSWTDEARVIGLQVALLLASREVAAERVAVTYNVLDHIVMAPPDGRLRRVVTLAQAFRARMG